MYKYFFAVITLFFISTNVNSNENLLTIQQQLERLQREVSDLSQTVFSNQSNTNTNQSSDVVTNLSAIDMRIYDLEKDVKNLTANIEEVFFQLEDISIKINNFQEVVLNLENRILGIVKENQKTNNQDSQDIINDNNQKTNASNENSLGSLKITMEDNNNSDTNNTQEDNNDLQKTEDEKPKLSPEDQFQVAFDNIRNKNWDESKKLLIEFIENNPENQLSGSAHYWLGELYILENQHRDAALIFAEGYQKFPDSIKAPDILYKLSESLYQVNKVNESCKTLEMLILDFPKNKFIKNAKKLIQNYGCLDANE